MSVSNHIPNTLKRATFLRRQESSQNTWIPCQARNVSY
jgi:hypothetical protein